MAAGVDPNSDVLLLAVEGAVLACVGARVPAPGGDETMPDVDGGAVLPVAGDAAMVLQHGEDAMVELGGAAVLVTVGVAGLESAAVPHADRAIPRPQAPATTHPVIQRRIADIVISSRGSLGKSARSWDGAGPHRRCTRQDPGHTGNCES